MAKWRHVQSDASMFWYMESWTLNDNGWSGYFISTYIPPMRGYYVAHDCPGVQAPRPHQEIIAGPFDTLEAAKAACLIINS